MNEPTSSPTPLPARSRSVWPRRVALGLCLALGVGVAYLIWKFLAAFQFGANNSPQQVVQVTLPTTPPVTAPQEPEALQEFLFRAMHQARQRLEEERVPVPDEQNSALRILTALPLLPGQPTYEKRHFELIRLGPVYRLREEQLAGLKKDLEQSRPALAELKDLATLPRGRFPPPIGGAWYDKRISKTSYPIANLLRWQSAVQAQEGDADAALTSCRAVLGAGRSIGDEPTAVPQQVRLACRGLALQALERALAQGTPSDASLAAAQSAVEDEAKEPLFLIMLQGERARDAAWFDKVEQLKLRSVPTTALPFPSGDLKEELLPLETVKALHLWFRRQTFELIWIAQRPDSEWSTALAAVELEFDKATPLEKAAVQVVSHILPKQHVRSQARLRCGIVALAVERYRRANDRWPGSLNDLCPKYLSAVPVDLYDGKPLRYHRTPDGVIIYVVGPSEKDDVEALLNVKSRNGLGAEFGFQLWDVDKRGQAQPVKKDGEEGD